MKNLKVLSVTVLAALVAPGIGWACACGCGVFDVGTSSTFPQGPGGMLSLEYDYQDQDRNWSGSSQAPAADNGDKEIRTHFITADFQYMFDRSWGVEVEVPYDFRHYAATAGGTTGWSSLGDMRVKGIYTGFFPDMSAGLTFGLKLPTGNDNRDLTGLLDRDTELGSGSTDILLGGFYRHTLRSVAHGLFWFGQTELDVPVLTQGGYRPGVEVDSALGLYYQGLSLGNVQITPVAQAIFSERTSDTGSWASGGVNDPPVGVSDSGYQRVMLSPGIEFDIHPISIYADVELPVYQYFTGDQLAAPALFKLIVTYHF